MSNNASVVNKAELFDTVVQEIETKYGEGLISEERLKRLKYYWLFKPNGDAEIRQALTSKLWRLNNCYEILDRNGKRVKFKMKKVQLKAYLLLCIHKRIIFLKSRQQGISTFMLVYFYDDIITIPDLNAGLISISDKSNKTLLKRIKRLWRTTPNSIKRTFNLSQSSDNASEFSLDNGSALEVSNSTFRSDTLQRLHISEYALIARLKPDKAREIKEGSIETTHEDAIVVIECTGEGENDFKRMWDAAVKNLEAKGVKRLNVEDFMPVFLSWLEDEKNVRSEHEEMNEVAVKYFEQLKIKGHVFSQEQINFWCSKERIHGQGIFKEHPADPQEAFYKDLEGRYFYNSFMTYVRRNHKDSLNNKYHPDRRYNPLLPIYAAMDLGYQDPTVIGLCQVYPEYKDWVIFDEYKCREELIPHFCLKLKEFERLYGQRICKVFLPHDARRENKLQQFKDNGIDYFEVLAKPQDSKAKLDRIEAVRRAIPTLYICKDKCPYLISCLLNYSKTWNNTNQYFDATQPVHDAHFCHGADMIRYMVEGIEEFILYEGEFHDRSKTSNFNKLHAMP